MMKLIKFNLIDMALGLFMMDSGFITALSLSYDFKANHTLIGSLLSLFIIFGCVLAIANFVIVALKLSLKLFMDLLDIKPNEEIK